MAQIDPLTSEARAPTRLGGQHMPALQSPARWLLLCGLIAGLLLSVAGAIPLSHIPDVQWERLQRNGPDARYTL